MFSDFLIRARALFRRKAVERKLNDELRFHFEQQVEKSARTWLRYSPTPNPECARSRLPAGSTACSL